MITLKHITRSIYFLLAILLLSTTALATPPATIASCEGIQDAYPILGKKCATEYAKINHAPANRNERAKTLKARIAVLTIFRKAYVCNGIWGATKSAQQRFISSEEGHLMAVDNLINAMTIAGDPNVPDYDDIVSKLHKVSMTKQQCK